MEDVKFIYKYLKDEYYISREGINTFVISQNINVVFIKALNKY